MTDALFQTPTAAAPVAAVGTTPAAHALGAAGAVPVAPDPGDGAQASPAALRGEAQPAGLVLQIHVVGIPAPQGSKRHVGNGVMVESSSKRLKPWRQDVKQAALDALELAQLAGAWPGPLTDCDIDVTFLMPRPRSHYRTGRYAHLLRPDAPTRHTSRPDGDKLMRSTLDALKVAGVYQDDANVVIHTGRKYYSSGHSGAVIHVYTEDSSASPAATIVRR